MTAMYTYIYYIMNRFTTLVGPGPPIRVPDPRQWSLRPDRPGRARSGWPECCECSGPPGGRAECAGAVMTANERRRLNNSSG